MRINSTMTAVGLVLALATMASVPAFAANLTDDQSASIGANGTDGTLALPNGGPGGTVPPAVASFKF